MTWLISKALMDSYEKWHSSQGLEEESSEDICMDGEPSAQSSGNRTQLAYLPADKMTKFSRLSQYGMMFKPLTESRGEDLLTWFREDFLAKIYPVPEKEQELPETEAVCGRTWQGSLARYDPNTHSLKTAQCSLFEDLTECYATLPRWGLMQSGELYQQPVLVRPTSANESGLWLTPSTVDIPTRSAESMKKRLDYRAKIGRDGVGAGCLSEQVEWSKNGPPIGYVTKNNWSTPTASEWKGRGPNSKQKGLCNEVKYPTPTAHMAKETNAPSEALRNEPSLTSLVGGKLNPMWVEWLMGWPIGWTKLEPLESFTEFDETWWDVEPVPRVLIGATARADRLKAIGNGQVSIAAATAWQILGKQ